MGKKRELTLVVHEDGLLELDGEIKGDTTQVALSGVGLAVVGRELPRGGLDRRRAGGEPIEYEYLSDGSWANESLGAEFWHCV